MALDWQSITNPPIPQRPPVAMGVQGAMPLPEVQFAPPPQQESQVGGSLAGLGSSVISQFKKDPNAPKKISPQLNDAPLRKPMTWGSPMGSEVA